MICGLRIYVCVRKRERENKQADRVCACNNAKRSELLLRVKDFRVTGLVGNVNTAGGRTAPKP